jgi:hypothetical protein
VAGTAGAPQEKMTRQSFGGFEARIEIRVRHSGNWQLMLEAGLEARGWMLEAGKDALFV